MQRTLYQLVPILTNFQILVAVTLSPFLFRTSPKPSISPHSILTMAQITPAKATLLSLPLDLLLILPNYLNNIEDHMNLSLTCHALHNALSKSHPNTILRLAAAS